jgi:5-methylcytosine-specific restriction protein A
MIKSITHGINLIRHHFRDLSVSAKRSDKWPTVEKHFLQANPKCAVCDGTERLNVHHCVPFHLDPTKELDPTNLITLCMGEKECHLKIGHCGNFKLYNPNIRKDAALLNTDVSAFEKVAAGAKKNAKVN